MSVVANADEHRLPDACFCPRRRDAPRALRDAKRKSLQTRMERGDAGSAKWLQVSGVASGIHLAEAGGKVGC